METAAQTVRAPAVILSRRTWPPRERGFVSSVISTETDDCPRACAAAPGARKISTAAGASAMAVAAAKMEVFGEVIVSLLICLWTPFLFRPALTQELSHPMLHSDPTNSDFRLSIMDGPACETSTGRSSNPLRLLPNTAPCPQPH